MARNTWEVEDDDETEDGPKALRDALKAAQKELAGLRKTNEELQGKFRAGTVSDFLKTKELPTKLAKFILRDLEGDPTPEAVEDWLTENGDLFGVKLPEKADDVVSSDDRDALRKIANIDNSAARPVGEDAQLDLVKGATSYEELMKHFGGSGQ